MLLANSTQPHSKFSHFCSWDIFSLLVCDFLAFWPNYYFCESEICILWVYIRLFKKSFILSLLKWWQFFLLFFQMNMTTYLLICFVVFQSNDVFILSKHCYSYSFLSILHLQCLWYFKSFFTATYLTLLMPSNRIVWPIQC